MIVLRTFIMLLSSDRPWCRFLSRRWSGQGSAGNLDGRRQLIIVQLVITPDLVTPYVVSPHSKF